MKIIIVLLLLIFVNAAHSESLSPFKSDGCSVFPDGTFEKNDLWLACCIAHDKAYWKGGTYREKKAADRELEKCVESLGRPFIAQLMRVGVSIGGSPYLPTGFRWGYGWPYARGYKALTDEENKRVADSP